MMGTMQVSPPPLRQTNLRKGLVLEYFTLGWNVLEAIVGLVAGTLAGSVALVGFALDSIVEATSGSILIWRLRIEQSGKRSAEEAEQRAIRLVAVAFLALAAYVGGRAVYDLAAQSRPDESPVGVGLALVSLVVMPILATRKARVARSLDSRALQADSTQTTLCTISPLSCWLAWRLMPYSAGGGLTPWRESPSPFSPLRRAESYGRPKTFAAPRK